MIFDIILGWSTEKKVAMGLAGLAGLAGFYAEIKDGATDKAETEKIIREEAKKASTEYTRSWYEKKGNPNKRRKSS